MKRVMPIAALFLVGIANGSSLQRELEYGKAVTCAQTGDWKKTQECLSSLVIDAPDRFDLLYDNGVAAYRLSEFDKAAAYFQTVTTSMASDELKKQAHFNLGNSHVALNKLPDAVTDYEAVLKIEPSNEPARHNLEKVRQMMQQQDKQNQQDKKNDKKDDQKKDQKEDQKENSGDGKDNKQNKKNDGSPDKKPGDKKEQKGNDQQNDDSAGNEEKEQSPDKQQGGQGESKPDKKSNEQDSRGKQDELRDNHDSSSESRKEQKESKKEDKKSSSKANSQPTKNDSKEQEIQAGAIEDNENERKKEDNDQLLAQLGPDKKWMAQILNRQEKADEKAQKKLVRAAIDKEMAGQDGQNCW